MIATEAASGSHSEQSPHFTRKAASFSSHKKSFPQQAGGKNGRGLAPEHAFFLRGSHGSAHTLSDTAAPPHGEHRQEPELQPLLGEEDGGSLSRETDSWSTQTRYVHGGGNSEGVTKPTVLWGTGREGPRQPGEHIGGEKDPC